MNGTRNGRILRIALAISFAVHLVFAAVVHPHIVQAEPQQQPKTMIVIVVHPKSPPTPKPQPKRPQQPQMHSNPAVRPPVHVVHLANDRNQSDKHASGPVVLPAGTPGDGGYDVSPGPVATETAEPAMPSPTPKPSCTAPDVAARTLEAVTPDKPDDTTSQGFNGTAKIKVDLDANGSVLGASIYESTGLMELDRAALEAARASRYAPEQRNCKNVPGSYLFTVDFQ